MNATRTAAHPTWKGSRSKYQTRAQAKYSSVNDTLVSPWAIITTACGVDMCLRASCMVVKEPVLISYPRGTCVYCGEPAGGFDHLMPRALTGDRFRDQVAIVPCCAHCNATINDTFSISVSERREICHERLRRRNRVLLESPVPTPEDLRAMGHVLRESAKAYRNRRRIIEARLAWPSDPHYDRRAFEKSGIDFAGEMGLL